MSRSIGRAVLTCYGVLGITKHSVKLAMGNQQCNSLGSLMPCPNIEYKTI